MTRPLRLGTRGSLLARTQSGIVADLLIARGLDVALVPILTAGDIRKPDTAWGEGAFVGALEAALRVGSIDLAVHSAKDVPIEPEMDLVTAAYPVRADARDALVLKNGPGSDSPDSLDPSDSFDPLDPFGVLPCGAVVGTDSPRRTGFIRAVRPDVRVVPLHGNVDTRLRRLDSGQVDALVLAVAGLERLGLRERVTVVLPVEVMPPAPGQGALAVQARRSDERVGEALAAIDDAVTRTAVTLERAVLDAFGGGCRAPVGAFAAGAASASGSASDELRLVAGAVSPDGNGRIVVERMLRVESADRIARAVGRRLADLRTDRSAAVGATA